MPEITGSDTYFTNIVAAATFTPTQWEACIDQAIDKINGHLGEDMVPNLSGTAGSKTVSVSSAEAGFIRDVTIAIYASTKNAGASSSSLSIGQISESSSSSTSSGASQIDELAKSAANSLRVIESELG